MSDHAVRFHQAISFLPTRQAIPLARASDELGYGGMYVSDHLFNPRQLESRYTYSTREDGAPSWGIETPWPDPMTVIAAMAGATENLLFTTGVYIAPLRDLMTVAKTVGTTAVLWQTTACASASGSAGARRSSSRLGRTSPPGAGAWTR